MFEGVHTGMDVGAGACPLGDGRKMKGSHAHPAHLQMALMVPWCLCRNLGVTHWAAMRRGVSSGWTPLLLERAQRNDLLKDSLRMPLKCIGPRVRTHLPGTEHYLLGTSCSCCLWVPRVTHCREVALSHHPSTWHIGVS